MRAYDVRFSEEPKASHDDPEDVILVAQFEDDYLELLPLYKGLPYSLPLTVNALDERVSNANLLSAIER